MKQYAKRNVRPPAKTSRNPRKIQKRPSKIVTRNHESIQNFRKMTTQMMSYDADSDTSFYRSLLCD